MASLEEALAAARSGLRRVAPEDFDRHVAAGAVVVDTRTADQRRRDGDLPGALVIDRTVLEWRLSPTSSSRITDIGPDREVIVVCSQGFSSSFAAESLQRVGLAGATDLIGGFAALAAYRAAALGRR